MGTAVMARCRLKAILLFSTEPYRKEFLLDYSDRPGFKLAHLVINKFS